MTFSNKKEDVMYLELTPYGRQLLSRGELKPEYYAFFDDDILYDISTVSDGSSFLTETNGEIKERILNETQYLKTQANFTNREDMIASRQNVYLYEDLSVLENSEKLNFLNYPLGTSIYHSGKLAPYWNVAFLHGTASSASKTLSSLHRLSASLPYKNIPQVEISANYEVSVKNVYTEEEDFDMLDKVSPNIQITDIGTDGSYLSLKESQLMLYILEENAFKHSDSFEVEIFMYDESDEKNLIPLKFQKDYDESAPKVIGDFFVEGVDPPVEDAEVNFPDYGLTNNPDYVGYYFDLRIDKGVPEEDICNGVMALQRKDIFVDLDVECIERDEARDVDIYTTRVTDIEEC
jgi:hypothetical protein